MNHIQTKSRVPILIFFVLATVLFLRVLFDTDFGWHIMVGRYIWDNHMIPPTDIFTFSAPDYPYVYHSWLSETWLYLTYSWAGLWGVTIFYAIIGALILLLMFKTINLHSTRQSSAFWYLLLIIPLILDASNLRIQLISFLGLSLIYFLYLHWLSHRSRWLFITPIIFIFWVNLHGGFILGLAFYTLILIIELGKIIYQAVKPIQVWGTIDCLKPRPLLSFASIVGVCYLASLISPYHYRAYEQALEMGTNQFALSFNSDWYPIIRPDAPETFIYTALVLMAIFLLLIVKTRLDLRDKLLIMIFFLLSLKNRRFVVPLLVVLIPSFSVIVNQLVTDLGQLLTKLWPINKLIYPLIVLVAITPALIWIPRVATAYQNDQTYALQIRHLSTKVYYPYEAVEFLKHHPLPQRIFNDFNWGGYLVWHIPEMKTFIDGRMDNFIINHESFAKQYLTMVNLLPGWQQLLNHYQFDTILLAPYHPLVQMLTTMPEWKLVYEDQVAVIFVRSDREPLFASDSNI